MFPAVRTLLGAILVLLLGSGVAASQGPGEKGLFGPPVDVTLVEVAVVVEDREGRPVSGLRRQDFQVFLDGDEVPVRTFQPPSSSFLSKADGSFSGPSPPHWILLIEPQFLAPGDLPDVLEAIEEVLEQDLPPGALLSLVTARGGLRVLSSFTADAAEIGAHFDALAKQVSLNSLLASEGEIHREVERLVSEGRDSLGRDQDQAARTILSRIRAVVAEGERGLAATAARLRQVIPLAAGLSGSPTIVYVTGRLPMRLEESLVQTWESAFGRFSSWEADGPEQGAATQGSVGRIGELNGDELFRDLASYAGSLGVTIHTVDAGALRDNRSSVAGPNSGGAGRSTVLAVGKVSDDGPQRLLAEATGGRSAVGTRAFREVLGEAAGDLSQRYILGISPIEGAGDGLGGDFSDVGSSSARTEDPRTEAPRTEDHKLEVRLRNGDPFRLRHPGTVRARGSDDRAADRTRTALVLGVTGNPLQVEVEVGARREGGRGKQMIPLAVRLPLANLALVAEGRDHVGRISVFATSGDLRSGVQPVQKSVLPVRVSNEDLLTSMGRLVEYRFDLPVGADTETIAIGVRDDFAPSTSTLRLESEAGGSS